MDWLLGWSKVEKIESGGRYPLGLNRFHSGMDDILIKSITEQANRLRYITYYCWVIGDIYKNTTNLTYVEFVKKFHLLENALTVGLYLYQPDAPFYGKDNINVKTSKDKTECNLDFQLMHSNLLGGFGLYYVGPMQNLGLIEINNNGIYSLTKKGEELYRIYESYLLAHKTKYYESYISKDIVPTDVLLEWGRINDLDNIAEDECEDERSIYKYLQFRMDKKETSDFRRQSLCLFLEAINQSQRNNAKFTETTLKNIHYYQMYFDRDNKVVKFDVPEFLKEAIFYWNIYEGHGYFRGWMEKYLQIFLEFLKANDDGVSFDDFFDSLNLNEINTHLSSFIGEQIDFLNSPLDELKSIYKGVTAIDSVLSEESLLPKDKSETITMLLSKFTLTIMAIIVRYESVRVDKRYLFIQDRRMGDLWFDKFYYIPNIRKMTVLNFLKMCLKEYVIQQHDVIMYEKRDLRKCWFTTENGKYFFQADASPIWRPAKFRTIMNFLQDMKLIETQNDSYVLTKEGSNLYTEFKDK